MFELGIECRYSNGDPYIAYAIVYTKLLVHVSCLERLNLEPYR